MEQSVLCEPVARVMSAAKYWVFILDDAITKLSSGTRTEKLVALRALTQVN